MVLFFLLRNNKDNDDIKTTSKSLLQHTLRTRHVSKKKTRHQEEIALIYIQYAFHSQVSEAIFSILTSGVENSIPLHGTQMLRTQTHLEEPLNRKGETEMDSETKRPQSPD